MENKLIYSLYEKKYLDIGIEKTLELIKKYDTNQIIGGIEINSYNLKSLKYCAKFCQSNNLKFKCHFPLKEMSEKETKDYLNCISEISNELGYTVNIVFHSVNTANTIEAKLEETKIYINNIRNYIYKFNLNVNPSLENLNLRNGVKRINIENIDTVLTAFDNLNFTYDIGHDLFDNKIASKLSSTQKERLNNIHIHSILNNEDHHIISNTCIDLPQIQKAVKQLKDINYTGDIILEYSVDYLTGNTTEEKIYSFVQTFAFFNELIKNI